MIVDARATNQMCQRCPKVRLPTGDSFARIEIEPEQWLWAADADIDNAFHRLLSTPEMSEFFGLPVVSA